MTADFITDGCVASKWESHACHMGVTWVSHKLNPIKKVWMTLGHWKSKFAEFRTKILIQRIAEFCPLQTGIKGGYAHFNTYIFHF